MTKCLAAAFAVTAAVATSANADLIAYWAQNSNALPGGGNGFLSTAFPQAADVGSGTISVGGGLFSQTAVNTAGDDVYSWIQSFAGTTGNVLDASYISGGSISVQGGTDGTTNGINNGGYLEFAFSMSGLADLVVSYDTRGTSTGFTSQTWSWSIDGVTFTDFEVVSGTNVTSWSTRSLAALSALDGAATAFLRVTFDGATSSSGNNRLDNIQLNAIPAPGAIALLGLAGLAARRRR